MNLAAIQQGAARDALTVMGTCPVEAGDNLPSGTLVMLGPKEPGFWAHVSDAPEFADGAPDPLDRWSARVIGALAKTLGGTALFPFGDPPRPFIGWALRTGRVWSSPVGLLVHDTARAPCFVPGGHSPDNSTAFRRRTKPVRHLHGKTLSHGLPSRRAVGRRIRSGNMPRLSRHATRGLLHVRRLPRAPRLPGQPAICTRSGAKRLSHGRLSSKTAPNLTQEVACRPRRFAVR